MTVSLTTTSRRIGEWTGAVVNRLLRQSVVPARVVLWLSPEPHLLDDGVSKEQVPESLRALENERFCIRWTRNLGPYRKLLPALEAYGGAIVTADDDTLYPREWLHGLLTMQAETPGAICAYRAHRMLVGSDGEFARYWRWPSFGRTTPGHDCFPTGKDGVLYPAGSLHPDVLDSERLLRLCPTNDDIWFKVMALRQGTPARDWPGHDTFPLAGMSANIGGLIVRYNMLGNDEMLRRVFAEFSLQPTRVCTPSTDPASATPSAHG